MSDLNKLEASLSELIGSENVLRDEDMKEHTSFKIGGKADLFLDVDQIEHIKPCIDLIKASGAAYYVVGNGSNLLVSDDGFRGVIVKVGQKCAVYSFEEDGDKVKVKVSAGMSLIGLSRLAADKAYSGLEFAAGIPGTIGGALAMNAGAYGSEMKEITLKARVLDSQGEIVELYGEELGLRYRGSAIADQAMIVLDAELELEKGDKAQIEAKIKENMDSRKEKQPLEYPNAGSTFKRPEGYIAAKLIQDTGLKGFSIGGAQVSEKHAGFIVNKGGASARDVLQLTDIVAGAVEGMTGVSLELEIKKVGM